MKNMRQSDPTIHVARTDSPISTQPRQPIFIVGHPRSGTTLLRALLGAHEQIHVLNEPDLFMNMRSAGFSIDHRFSADDRRKLINFFRSKRSSNRYLESVDENKIKAFLNSTKEASFQETFESLVQTRNDKPYWGTKSLQNGYFIRDILTVYPRAIVIPIVRDPRAALLSTYRKRLAHSANCIPKFGREGIAFFSYEAMRWGAAMDVIHEARNDADRSALHKVRYESIVTNPESEIRSLCDAIQIPYDPEMSSVSRRSNDPLLKSTEAYAHRNLSSSIDPSRAAGGKDLPEWASYIINQCAGETARREGYDFRTKPKLAQRIIIQAGLSAFRSKMQKRLTSELKNLCGVR